MAPSYGGSFCEYALVDMEGIVRIPETETKEPIMSLAEAAAIPAAVWPAYIALFDKLRIEAGHSIFIDNGASGIGAAAVQLAHSCGVVVIAACDTKDTEFVKSLGAQAVLNSQLGDKLIDTVLHLTNGCGVDGFLSVSDRTDAETFSDVVRFGGALCLTNSLIVSQSSTLFTRQLSVHYVFLDGLYEHPVSLDQLSYVGAQVLDLWKRKAFAMHVTEVPLEEGAKSLDAVMQGEPPQGDTVLKMTS
ncbi:NADPH2:quinone reductase [Strigomonas culicis]|uniref:NADPH2:quinone reductase n=1 Tax=Strigomonas culicis TaxID=28005 RepID=S9TSD4_9TRYP|nr:NADPH2:quinone reductase [Strigomonas culicis]|eukprot:EPY19423.1 NADPH2:quinone reductase [Strigomonas culicis]